MTTRPYALGHSDAELRRLARQGAFFRELTDNVLRRAGLVQGMRVLDIGCGAGDVSLLAGEIVGSTGAVLGVDRAPEAIAIARRRAEVAQMPWLQFATGALDTFSSNEKFDALIGRLVLMYLPEPANTLRQLLRHLHPGAIVAFQEMVIETVRSTPDIPSLQQCRRLIIDTFRRTGIELDMGGKLYASYVKAGLPAPHMTVGGCIDGSPDSPVYEIVAETLRSLLPVAESAGVVGAADVDIDTLAERLRRECEQRSGCIMTPVLVGAWSRVPQ